MICPTFRWNGHHVQAVTPPVAHMTVIQTSIAIAHAISASTNAIHPRALTLGEGIECGTRPESRRCFTRPQSFQRGAAPSHIQALSTVFAASAICCLYSMPFNE